MEISKKVLSICKREILSYFVSPIAYFLIAGFLLLSGYFFFNLLGGFNIILQRIAQMPWIAGDNTPNLNQWVIEGYYQTILVILVFMIPVLTMRTIAEDKKKGTFELLMTSPLSITDIVLGKFLGVASIITIMLIGSFFFPLLLLIYGDPGPEALPVWCGFLGVLLCSLGFASIGVAASACTENQIIAGIVGMVAILLLYVIHSPAEQVGGSIGELLKYLSPVLQVQDLVKGVISLKSIVYFLSLIGFGLFLSQRALEAERWR